MVVYLYRAQRRVASPGVVAVLTALRITLVLLAFVLLAGPAVRWKRVGSSGGTLWVVVDQSGSMAQADPQATPVEKLRWADALGFLPADTRASKLDRAAARLSALRGDLVHLRIRGELATDGRAAAKEVSEYAASLRASGDSLRALADDVEKDPQGPRAAADVCKAVRLAAQRVNEAADKAAGRPRREDAARDLPWDDLLKSIDPAVASLRSTADAADQKFLADHASDEAVTAAVARVAKLTRAEMARLLFATDKSGRETALTSVVPRQKTNLVTFAEQPQVFSVRSAPELGSALKASAAAESGQSTNMAAPLRYVAGHMAQEEPASVVFVGDGRDNSGGDLVEPARQLAARGVRVFTLALGSQQVAPDAAVEQVDAPDWVYQDDTVRGSALLRLDGLSGKPVTVDFYRGEKKIDTKTVTPTQERATQVVSFSDKPPEPGVFEYDVRVAPLPNEAVKENNRLGSRVAVKKDKLAVLVVEDQPRWEYRHLVNYLSRDRRVKLQTVLLQPARVDLVERPAPVRASPKNEGVEARLLPERKEDWAAFDFIVLGDVPREALSEQDQQNLAWAVKDRGAALLLIAGPFNMPQRFAGTPLAELSPVELSGGDWAAGALPEHLKAGFRAVVAPEGQASILSQFTIDESGNVALWSALPAWYWHSEFTQAKRSASVVWSIGESSGSGAMPSAGMGRPAGAEDTGSLDSARQRALLATASVGMGRVMYLASDSTWRLRQVNGQNPHERFWGQVIRWVVGNELPAGGKLVRFGTDKPRYVAGEPVVVTARLVGEDYAPLKGQKVKAVARVGADAGAKPVAEADLIELPDAPGYYRATLGGVPAGRVDVSLQGGPVEQLLAKEQVAAAQRTLAVDVQSQLSVEQRNVNADRAAMVRLAEAGGGIALDGPYADVLAAHLPKLNYETETVEQFGLFASPKDPHTRTTHWLFLAIFAAVATAEWVIRKAAGLV
jgi:hypothetical protein